MMTVRKLTFEEAKQTTHVFYKDDKLEEWFDKINEQNPHGEI